MPGILLDTVSGLTKACNLAHHSSHCQLVVVPNPVRFLFVVPQPPCNSNVGVNFHNFTVGNIGILS